MALPRCFVAADRLTYIEGGAGAYHAYLLTAPRIYGEELYCFANPTAIVGVVWVEPTPNRYGPATIRVLSGLQRVSYPGYGTATWSFDAQYGYFLPADVDDPEHDIDPTDIAFAFDRIAVEPSGAKWWYGLHVPGNVGGAIALTSFAPLTPFSPPLTVEVPNRLIVPTDWLDARGDVPTGIIDLAIDSPNDRMLVRWNSNTTGEVSIYRILTKTFVASVFVPNATAGIVLTGDRLIYVVDSSDWICVYDYDGVFHGVTRNPRREPYSGAAGGVAYCWDGQYKRLLAIEGRDNGVDGHCRVRVRGFYPTPDAAIVCPPIPRQVPRAGRTIMVWSRIFGEGAESLGARRAQVTGDVTATISSDGDGDIILPITPSAAGAFDVDISVDASVTPADTAET